MASTLFLVRKRPNAVASSQLRGFHLPREVKGPGYSYWFLRAMKSVDSVDFNSICCQRGFNIPTEDLGLPGTNSIDFPALCQACRMRLMCAEALLPPSVELWAWPRVGKS